jgi:hypothetical protein
MTIYIDDEPPAELVAEERARRAYRQHFRHHPDPRDPDYLDPEDFGLEDDE